jgi:hypothetical protein
VLVNNIFKLIDCSWMRSAKQVALMLTKRQLQANFYLCVPTDCLGGGGRYEIPGPWARPCGIYFRISR